MPSCKHVSMVGTYSMHGRLNSDGYGYTRGYGSGRVVIWSTGRVQVRVMILCYGYGSGSKNAVPADLYWRYDQIWRCVQSGLRQSARHGLGTATAQLEGQHRVSCS